VPGRAPDLLVTGRRVVTPEGTRPAAIAIRNGIIVAVTRPDEAPRDAPVLDAGDAVVMPGIIDTHVHADEPGRVDWEGFESATRAAAAGGITMIVDMPVHAVPPTTRPDALRLKIALAETQAWIDVGFWAGLGRGDASYVRALCAAGAFGFKAYLIPPGADGLREVDEGELRLALPLLRECGVPLIVHAEMPAPIERAWAELAADGADARLYANWLRARPIAAENEAVALLIELAREFETPIHVSHLSGADMLPDLRRARAAGVPITIEASPHYLHFAAEEIPDGATEFKCAPPIREFVHREALWEALGDGTIDTLASAHAPCPPELKRPDTGDFASAWPGIAGIQLMLPVVWTGAHVRGFSPHHLAEWLCAAPARLLGLEQRKGSIAPGRDADLVIWEDQTELRVEHSRLEQRHKMTPYDGLTLTGRVQTTMVRGEVVYDRGVIVGERRGRVMKS
jgi:allantoinase